METGRNCQANAPHRGKSSFAEVSWPGWWHVECARIQSLCGVRRGAAPQGPPEEPVRPVGRSLARQVSQEGLSAQLADPGGSGSHSLKASSAAR
jgi:hypothetical protein